MKTWRLFACLCIAACVLAVSSPSRASGGVQDPGFSYVDVNNDGLYNALDGDIGPVDTYIQDGYFDTSRSEGLYHAPCYPVSLVVSRSQAPITPGVPITLKAGVNLISFTNLGPAAPSITLCAACRNVYLAATVIAYQNSMTIWAGRDVNIDGTQITGTGASSALCINAGGDISGRPYVAVGIPVNTVSATGISVGRSISTSSCGCTVFDGASIAATQSGSSVDLEASGALEAINSTNIAAFEGAVEAESDWSFVRLQSDQVSGSTLEVEACAATIVDSSVLVTTGATTIEANGPVDGISTVIAASSVCVNSCDCVDLDSSNIFTSSGAINVAGRGDVTANSSTWEAASNICVTSTCGDIYARTARMTVDSGGPISFYAGGGLIDVTGSVFSPTPTYGPNNVTVIGALP